MEFHLINFSHCFLVPPFSIPLAIFHLTEDLDFEEVMVLYLFLCVLISNRSLDLLLFMIHFQELILPSQEASL
jgi:hypothetical protein